MSDFEISLAFQSNKAPSRYQALARLADKYPFSHVSVYNDLSFQPALGPLLMMAPQITHAQLGPSCLNPFTVHPVEIAGQMAFLDLVTEGRAYLGIARGAWLDALGVNPAQPIGGVREAIQIVRQLLAGERREFDGRVFHLDAAYGLSYQTYRPRVPVMIGTWGPAMAAVAGEVADAVKVSPSAQPSTANTLRPSIAKGAQKAGRDPESIRLVLGGMCVVDPDRVRARGLARREVARYLPVVAPLDQTFEVDPDWLERLTAAARRSDWDGAAGLISDDILDRFAYSGDASDVIRILERAQAGGIDRIDLGTPHGFNEEEGVRMLGEQVLPYFR